MSTTEQSERVPAESFQPGEYIAEELEARNWSQSDLAEILGRPVRLVNELINGKRSITPETAKGLAQAFGTSAELWMNLESAYQLSRVRPQTDAVARRSKLYSYAPIKEMIRRGWLASSSNIETMEQQLRSFYGRDTLEEVPEIPVAARAKRVAATWTPAQVAWFYRARQLGSGVSAEGYTPKRFDQALSSLSTLWSDAEGLRRVPAILAEAGIRLVVVEDLPGTKVDGACLWLNKSSPVVALSLRFDRIDSVWHTLLHELGHVSKGHASTLDVDLFGPGVTLADAELEANRFACETMVPQKELADFIARTSPLFSRSKIEAFAARMNVHPGIVLGQLKHKKIIDWPVLVVLHAKVRAHLIPAALTDGYGHIPPVPLG